MVIASSVRSAGRSSLWAIVVVDVDGLWLAVVVITSVVVLGSDVRWFDGSGARRSDNWMGGGAWWLGLEVALDGLVDLPLLLGLLSGYLFGCSLGELSLSLDLCSLCFDLQSFSLSFCRGLFLSFSLFFLNSQLFSSSFFLSSFLGFL